MGNKHGLTFVEVLVVIVIVTILALALAGVSVSAKAGAVRVVAIERLKQVGVATSLYQNDYGSLPVSIDRVSKYSRLTESVLKSEQDVTDGWGRISEKCISGQSTQVPTSIESSLSNPEEIAGALKTEVGKLAMLVDRTMTRVISRHQARLRQDIVVDRSDACTIFGFYQGRGVQLRYDLSAQIKDMSEVRDDKVASTVTFGLSQVFLLP